MGRGHPNQQLGLTRDRDRVGGTGRRGDLWALTRVEGVFIVGSSDRAIATVMGVRFMIAEYSRTHMKINKKTAAVLRFQHNHHAPAGGTTTYEKGAVSRKPWHEDTMRQFRAGREVV